MRPLATPLPVGFFALAIGTFVLAGLQLGWVGPAQGHAVALCLVALVVPLQGLAFIFAVLARDEAAASGMALLAGTWLAIGLVTLTSPPGSTSGALGLLLLGSTGTLLVVAGAASPSKPLAAAVIAVAALRFVLTGVYELGAGGVWQTTTGIVGLVLAALAWYAAAAFAMEDAASPSLLPTFRRAPTTGPVPAEQVRPSTSVRTSAGVRDRL